MFFVDNCEQYAYTKIAVPITLLKSPSDYDDSSFYLDINSDDFYQENCYVGTQRIEEVKIKRVKKADCECDHTAVWNLEMIICGGKTEDQIIDILGEICRIFSLKFIRYYKHFQNCGFEGFTYDRLRLERRYAYEDKVFSDEAMSMYCGCFEIKTISSIENKVFKLPQKINPNNEYKDKLTSAFLKALKCKDKISRYILLYYLFEIMYEATEYQALKEKYRLTYGIERCRKDRNVILFQYLQQEFDLIEYLSFGKKIVLEATTLEEIIETRNDLTHRGDLSKVSTLMYNHLLPILQKIIIEL